MTITEGKEMLLQIKQTREALAQAETAARRSLTEIETNLACLRSQYISQIASITAAMTTPLGYADMLKVLDDPECVQIFKEYVLATHRDAENPHA